MRAWAEEHDVKPPSFKLGVRPVNISQDAYVDWLVDQIRKHEAQLVVIDTYSKCSRGINEDSSSDTRLIIQNVYRARDAVEDQGTTVLVVHHSGKDETRGGRGSNALNSDLDFEFAVTRADDTVHVRCTKMKDGPEELDDFYELEEVPLSIGGTSCLLRPTDRPAEQMTKGRRQKAAYLSACANGATEAEVMECMAKLGYSQSQSTVNRWLREYRSQGLLSKEGKTWRTVQEGDHDA